MALQDHTSHKTCFLLSHFFPCPTCPLKFKKASSSNPCVADRLKVTHDVHHSWLQATPPLPPVMVMVMMMAVVTVVGSIELLYPSHHLAPRASCHSDVAFQDHTSFAFLVGQNSCGTEFLWYRIPFLCTSLGIVLVGQNSCPADQRSLLSYLPKIYIL